MSYIEKEKLIKADIASIENRVRHAFNQGYDLGFKDGKEKAKPLEQEPTTKNDLAQERYQDLIEYFGGEHIITDIVLNDKNMFKAWLDRVRWYIKRANELAKELEQLKSTTKNDLGVDCIDKIELLKAMDTWDKFGDDPNKGLILLSTPALQDRYVPYVKYDDMVNCVKGMPSVTPQEPKIFSIAETKYDKDKLKELVDKAVFTVTPNREREILDKIRAEIEQYQSDYDVHGTEYDRTAWKAFNRCLQIIDKYKAGSEPQKSEDDNAEQTYSGRGVKIYKEEIEDNY